VSDPASEAPAEDPLADTLARAIDEGERRLDRTWPVLLATGAVGGIDVGIGVLALLVVLHDTGNHLLAALAFGVGFVALILAGSELFTEDFLIPITALVTRETSALSVVRLWTGTAATNLVGGWVVTGLVILGVPGLRHTAVAVGSQYPSWGIGMHAFAAGILGGTVMTLLTWMERSTQSVPARLVAAFAIAFVLAAPPLNHAVVSSLEMFAALHAGAPFSYLDWAGAAAWAALANMIGGVLLVTMLRLVQIGKGPIESERRQGSRRHGG
jgi:formate/nitrite transporter FocA (FNT family)